MLRFRLPIPLIWCTITGCGALPYLVALHTLPMPTFYSEFVTGVCWVGLALVVLALTWGSKTGLPKIAVAPLALIAVLFVQLQAAPPLNPFMSLAATVFLLAAAAACVLGARSRDLPCVLEALAFGLIIGALATVAIELAQLFRLPSPWPAWIAGEPGGIDRRMWGNLNQPNHAASYLAFGLAACGFLGAKFRRGWILFVAIAVALMLGMSLTASRVTWLYIAVIGGLGGMLWTTDQCGSRRWLKACVPLVLLALIYQFCNWSVSYANVICHLDLPSSLGERMQQGVGLRPLLWKHAWHMFLAHPWLGGGWGDYAWNQYVQTDTLGHVEMSLNAHNIVLDQLAKVGLLGLLAIVLPLLSFAWSLRKRKLTPALAFLLALVLVMGAHSMVEYPLHYAFFLLPFAFALGYVDERTLRLPSASMTWTATAAVTVASGALMLHLWGDYKAVERLHYAPDGLQKELALYSQHGPTLLLPYEHLAMAIHFNVVPDMASSLAKLELQAMQFYPGSATVQRYALALAYLGKTDEAMVHVRRMHHHYWTNYAEQSWLFTQACDEHGDDKLKTFCTRLKSENLLVSAVKPPDGRLPRASR